MSAKHIDRILRNWPFDPNDSSVRRVTGDDGREVLQLRVDLGILQLETSGRPDGERPGGSDTVYDHLVARAFAAGDEFELSEDDCFEIDREFVQFYHRRHCWLRLHDYRRAVRDADHTLSMMDFCLKHSPDEHWTVSHEQYRPFVLFDRTQAAALAELQDDESDAAIAEIDHGLGKLRDLFAQHDAEELYEDHELVQRLEQMRETLFEQADPSVLLRRRLDAAIAAEEYELAAEIRDEIDDLDSQGI